MAELRFKPKPQFFPWYFVVSFFLKTHTQAALGLWQLDKEFLALDPSISTQSHTFFKLQPLLWLYFSFMGPALPGDHEHLESRFYALFIFVNSKAKMPVTYWGFFKGFLYLTFRSFCSFLDRCLGEFFRRFSPLFLSPLYLHFLNSGGKYTSLHLCWRGVFRYIKNNGRLSLISNGKNRPTNREVTWETSSHTEGWEEKGFFPPIFFPTATNVVIIDHILGHQGSVCVCVCVCVWSEAHPQNESKERKREKS